MSTYILSEINQANAIGTLAALSDDELVHLINVAERMLSKHESLFAWFSDLVMDELKVRASLGKLERGTPSISYRMTIEELSDMALMFHLWSHLPQTSEAERTWLKSVVEKSIILLTARAVHPTPDKLDRLLTTSDVCDRLNISREQLARLVKLGQVPKPIRIGPRTFRWHWKDLVLMLANTE